MHTPDRPRRAKTHVEGQFCNGECARCDDQMTRRALRYTKQHTQSISRIMRQAPGGTK